MSQNMPLSEETSACIGCHESVTPGIVEVWKMSRHSETTLSEAFAQDSLSRRVSITELPETNNNVVGCYECHSLNGGKHKDNFDHFDFKINVVVSPDDCSKCHPKEVEQYSYSKKAHAINNLKLNPVYLKLVKTILDPEEYEDGKLLQKEMSGYTKGEACFACHGTEIGVDGMKTIETDLGDIEIPNLTNWPNQGVGRQNPDSSLGACTACHPRHSFSIEIARKPYTCGQCHLEPDVPSYNVYKESKHGNIFSSTGEKWNWDEVPWNIGKDFKAPSCAACHNSLLIKGEGEVVAERTHDFGDRLWVRIFGLVYTHNQPLSGKTYEIKNSDGLSLPTTFTGAPASEFLISDETAEERKAQVEMICKSCHSTNWVESNFEKFDNTIKETDEMVRTATNLMTEIWNEGIENNENPFDERAEKLWQEQWLFYANSVRFASAMMGPDYASFKNGWWNMQHNLVKMHRELEKE
jgi:hypothetical protein